MNNMFRSGMAALVAVAMLASCADKKEESTDTIEQRSLDSWMAVNVNNGSGNPEALRYDNGIYIQWLETNPTGNMLGWDYWMEINYTGMTLDGNVFKTNNADIARDQGTFTLHTDYSPRYMRYDTYNTLTPAELSALSVMREGEKVRVYAPSKMAFSGTSTAFSNGYEGSYTIGAVRMPVIIELELVSVVSNPLAREGATLELFIANTGMNDKAEDSLYYKIVSYKMPEPEPEIETIEADDNIFIYYVGRIMEAGGDGLIFSTNIDSIASRIWGEEYEHVSISYKVASGGAPSIDIRNVMERALYPVLLEGEVPFQSHLKLAFISRYGYDYEGNVGLGLTEPYTEVPGYRPLEFDFYIQRKSFGDAEDPDYLVPDVDYGAITIP